jgi:hypothetical protein
MIAPARFRAKACPGLDPGWIPVRVKKTRQSKSQSLIRLWRAMGFEVAIASGMLIFVGTLNAQAQSFSASGQIGYLQEWEIKGSLAKTSTRTGADYSGPVTLRHVGLCSVNGVEQKSGIVQLKVSRSRLEGTLAMDDDSCRIDASVSQPYAGLLNCRNGQGVPINISIDDAAGK